ncbi:MAG: FAD-dependent oxidoreductase [Sphingobium sp.]
MAIDRTDEDVIVIGSGAGGLTAAVAAALDGARVLVIEGEERLGGTAALSGGAAWIPLNPHMASAGIEDSREDAETYIRRILGNRFDDRMIGAFLETGPMMVADLEARTSAVRFLSYAGSDYHPDLPGAKPRARSLMAKPFDGRALGPWLHRLRLPMRELTVFGGMQVDAGEAIDLQYSWRRWRSAKVAVPLLARYAMDRLRHGRGTRMIRGQALVARLLKSALDLDVRFLTDARAVKLVREDLAVTGVVVEWAGKLSTLSASGGVIIATGGFSAEPDMVRKHIPYPERHLRIMPESGTGSGLKMAQAIGAAMGTDNADNGIWMPGSSRMHKNGRVDRYPHFAFDRCKPGALIVDGQGRRFVNEAAPYHVLVRAMHARGAVPAWLIGDRPFLRKYGMGLARPFPYPARPLVKDGYLIEASSLDELAARLGMDGAVLQATVRRLNELADEGVDHDFGKGGDIFTRALGDARHGPNPCLGRIERGPFYALALAPSDCGTTLGLQTDEFARVLDGAGAVIPGLYACGLDMHAVLRGNYPGAGTMIGPAMTFGYSAGRHAASRLKDAVG